MHYATSGKDLGFNVCKKIYKTLPLFYSLCLVWNWNWSWWWKYFPAFNHFTPAPMWVTVENFHQKDADSFKRLPTIEFFGALIIWGTYFSVQNYKKWVYFGYRPTLLWKTTNNGFILDIDELFCGKKKNGIISDIDIFFCAKPPTSLWLTCLWPLLSSACDWELGSIHPPLPFLTMEWIMSTQFEIIEMFRRFPVPILPTGYCQFSPNKLGLPHNFKANSWNLILDFRKACINIL